MNESQSGCLLTSSTEEPILDASSEKTDESVLAIMGIIYEFAQAILHDDLEHCRFCVHWVPPKKAISADMSL